MPLLYSLPASPAVRAVMVTAKAIGLHLKLRDIDLLAGEHLTPEYLKVNPQHTVPVFIDDDGFTIWDSQAIMVYIISKYAPNDSLYPKDIKKRAIIDQRLNFNAGVIFQPLLRAIRPIIYFGKRSIEQSIKDDIIIGYEFLEAFLEDKVWVCGNSVTIADYSLICSITTLYLMVPPDLKKIPRTVQWLDRAKKLPEYEANVPGLADLATIIGQLD